MGELNAPQIPWGYVPDPAVIGGFVSLMEEIKQAHPEWFDPEGEVSYDFEQTYRKLVLDTLAGHFVVGRAQIGAEATLPLVAGWRPSSN